jgi:hypothetical protein
MRFRLLTSVIIFVPNSRLRMMELPQFVNQGSPIARFGARRHLCRAPFHGLVDGDLAIEVACHGCRRWAGQRFRSMRSSTERGRPRASPVCEARLKSGLFYALRYFFRSARPVKPMTDERSMIAAGSGAGLPLVEPPQSVVQDCNVMASENTAPTFFPAASE